LKIKDKKEKEIIRLLEEEKGKEMKQQWEALITQDIVQEVARIKYHEYKEQSVVQ